MTKYSWTKRRTTTPNLIYKGDAKTKCRMCGRQIARKDGNTSGMVRHLKLHSKTYKDFCAAKASKTVQKKKTSSEESSSQKSMKQMNLDFRAHEKWPTTHQKSQKIDDLILRFICLSAEPIQLTEKNGFSEIFDEICPSYRLKSREFMTKLLEEKYSEKFELLKKTIDAAPFISFTTDLWTNKKKKKNFLSLTAHYIDEGFERKWKVLSTEPMNEAHTGQNIRQCISEILKQFEIDLNRVHVILRDAASSMISATDELNVENFDCFCHKLNLALSDGLEHRTKSVPEIKKEIQMCRELVGFYNRSKNFQNVLRRQQDLIDAPKTGLIQDVITRWNSTLYMVDRIIQQQRALSLAQIDFPELKLPNFELLKNLSAVLAPFDKFTKQLSNRDESISSVLPIYRCLLTMLNEKCTDSDPMKLFKKIVVNGLKTRMAKYECKRFLVIATLIDPRYKNHPNIFSLEDRFQNKVLLKTEVELFINPSRRFSDSDSNNGPVIQHSDNPMANFLFTDPEFSGAILSQNDSTENEIGQEIDSFFKTSTIASDTNPLEFWRHNTTYPHIKQIVPKFLCPPPGSVDHKMRENLGRMTFHRRDISSTKPNDISSTKPNSDISSTKRKYDLSSTKRKYDISSTKRKYDISSTKQKTKIPRSGVIEAANHEYDISFIISSSVYDFIII
uniref:BED-type domain-containing protein n=1 Tax=Globodera rostochiensis TaxID=31243 RepID=A0A914HT81_GLORO